MSEREVTEPAEILLALPGDAMLCWGCGAEVATYVTGRYNGPNRPIDLKLLPAGLREGPDASGRYFYFCALCGSPAGPSCRSAGPLEQADAQVRIRSGSWTGWRAQGGE